MLKQFIKVSLKTNLQYEREASYMIVNSIHNKDANAFESLHLNLFITVLLVRQFPFQIVPT